MRFNTKHNQCLPSARNAPVDRSQKHTKIMLLFWIHRFGFTIINESMIETLKYINRYIGRR